MDKNIDISLNKIKLMNNNSCDIKIHNMQIKRKKIAYIFLESTSSDDKISDFLGKTLSANVRKKKMFDDMFNHLKNIIPNSNLTIINTYDDIFYYIASGFTCLLIDGYNKCIAVETRASLDRSVSEPSGEPAVKGPKDSFTENYQANLGLIRKRIKDNNLIFDEVTIGKRTKTKVSISYIKDIVDLKKVYTLKKSLENIDIDGIIDSSYIRELIIKKQKSIFPRILSTERPDLVAMSLLDGKVVIIVENTPYALIFPGVLTDFFKSPEDYYVKPENATFTRILRYFAFFIAIFLPSIYIAVTTFDIDILPMQLLISFATQRESVPFPTLVEVLILVLAYEILREADTRKPQIIGASISIVGALVIGEAVVSAGIISPIVVIIVSISAVAGMSFNDLDLINAIRIWRIIFMLSAGFFGLIGIILMFMIFISGLCSFDTFNTSYLSSIAPFDLSSLKSSIFRFSQSNIKKRPSYLNDLDDTRLGDNK